MSFCDELAICIGSRVAAQSLVYLTVSELFSYNLGYRQLSSCSHKRMLVQNRLQLLLPL
jgi:hypothetical protein